MEGNRSGLSRLLNGDTEDSGCSGLDSNQVLPKYRSDILILGPTLFCIFLPFPLLLSFFFPYIPTLSRLSSFLPVYVFYSFISFHILRLYYLIKWTLQWDAREWNMMIRHNRVTGGTRTHVHSAASQEGHRAQMLIAQIIVSQAGLEPAFTL
jgi:hypothetical protein